MSYNIDQFSKITGINKLLLRTWENRYEFLKAPRSKTKIRIYSDDLLIQALNTKLLINNGYKISYISNQNQEKIQQLVHNVKQSADSNVKEHIQYTFLKDGYFAELKNAEILRERLNLVNEVSPYIGKYFSVEYVRKNVLRQSDEDILDIDNQIRKEIKQGIIANPEGAQMEDDESTDINIGDN